MQMKSGDTHSVGLGHSHGLGNEIEPDAEFRVAVAGVHFRVVTVSDGWIHPDAAGLSASLAERFKPRIRADVQVHAGIHGLAHLLIGHVVLGVEDAGWIHADRHPQQGFLKTDGIEPEPLLGDEAQDMRVVVGFHGVQKTDRKSVEREGESGAPMTDHLLAVDIGWGAVGPCQGKEFCGRGEKFGFGHGVQAV